jgi:hypothetical protein
MGERVVETEGGERPPRRRKRERERERERVVVETEDNLIRKGRTTTFGFMTGGGAVNGNDFAKLPAFTSAPLLS